MAGTCASPPPPPGLMRPNPGCPETLDAWVQEPVLIVPVTQVGAEGALPCSAEPNVLSTASFLF